MPQWLKASLDYLLSPPMQNLWYLCLGLGVGCYVIALVLVHAVPSQTTVIHRCRRAWGMAFLIHAAATVIVMLSWYFAHRMLAGFGQYFVWYVVVLFTDLAAGLGLFFSARRFQRYSD